MCVIYRGGHRRVISRSGGHLSCRDSRSTPFSVSVSILSDKYNSAHNTAYVGR